ncbi:ABC transporter ATP-binding protein [Stella sp.]|uniref:ABC transporter ATP-binding protein n=1 Tax=Stella sp. TaxID=2912054 RepID=UPI0035AF3F94
MTAMLAYEGVSYRYPGGDAGVFDIELAIGEGELVAVIGPSGSGKTTMLKLLAGFVRPDRGRIAIGGRDMTALPAEGRDLGVVFQSYALFPHMTALENVAYPLKVRGLGRSERRRRAAEMLARVGLAERAGHHPAALSGGQQQRVALARALVFRPHGLLLDEPLSALDPGLRAGMRDEIRRIQREAAIATLLVTHDQEEALSIADRVCVMRAGRLVQVASPRELYDRPADAEIAAFVGQSNLWPATVAGPGRVRTALGELACDTGSDAAGAAVMVLVRPERVRPLAAAAAGRPGVLPGRVVADRFLGAARRVDFAVAGGLVLLETHSRDAVAAVEIPPDAIRLLPHPASTHEGRT